MDVVLYICLRLGDRKRRNLATGTIDDIGEIDTRLINQQARADDTEFGEYVVHHM
jgi:hypothetical protein